MLYDAMILLLRGHGILQVLRISQIEQFSKEPGRVEYTFLFGSRSEPREVPGLVGSRVLQ